MIIGGGVNELGRDPHPVAHAQDRAFDHRFDIQLRAISGIDLFVAL